MKSTLNFDRMPTLNLNAIRSFTLISLINYIFACLLKAEASKQKKSADTSIQRAAQIFESLLVKYLMLLKSVEEL
jgi:hypothetical protein